MRAVFVALISKFQLVILVERTSTFCPKIYLGSLKGLADLLKIHLGPELDPQDEKSSPEWETASFSSCFNTNPPRQDDDQKIKPISKKSTEIDAILA